MGLHLQTKQSRGEAEILVRGKLSGLAIAQLQAAIDHFSSRGCKVINVSMSQSDHASAPPVHECETAVPDEIEYAIR